MPSDTFVPAAARAYRQTARRAAYLARILPVYLFPAKGPLSFWYETPELNPRAFGTTLGEYYMTFAGKARYAGPFDTHGVPLLDYRGDIGVQHNPIAIAQYGVAMYNRAAVTGNAEDRAAFLRVADWLVEHLETNAHGLSVWQHHFDWPYRQRLVAPWYSGLAQGQGLSVLSRAAAETGDTRYAVAAQEAFVPFTKDVANGGVVARDLEGHLWIEEYLVDPPSHILNGFIWALWGVHDLWRWSGREEARDVFESGARTLAANLERYDAGSWSLYQLGDTPPMLASPYYHRLHIVQLRVLARLTGQTIFQQFAERWQRYADSRAFRYWALARKAWFKLRYY